jgi:hypothetical protein
LDLPGMVERVGLVKFLAHFLGRENGVRAGDGCE